MNNKALIENSMFQFQFSVVYRPIIPYWNLLILIHLPILRIWLSNEFGDILIFSHIICLNHGIIGLNTAFWPDIPSRNPQIITSNLRFSVLIWRSLDGISGHNHPKCSIYSLNKPKFNYYIDVIYPKELVIKDTTDAPKWLLILTFIWSLMRIVTFSHDNDKCDDWFPYCQISILK